MALDQYGNVWVTNNTGSPEGGPVTEYAAGAADDITPIATIRQLGFAWGLAVDSVGDVFVVNNSPEKPLARTGPVSWLRPWPPA